jgi:hypothetical protein
MCSFVDANGELMMPMEKRGTGGVARRSRQGKSRRWCIDTALTRDPDEHLEGDRVLKEVADDLGILLWRIGRDVVLWAETPSMQRAGPFSAEAPNRRSSRLLNIDLSDDLASAVDTLAGQLAVPEKADAAILTWCCRLVARWAAGHELTWPTPQRCWVTNDDWRRCRQSRSASLPRTTTSACAPCSVRSRPIRRS